MLTPYGQACPYYYADAHRKPDVRELCHLLDGSPDQAKWTSSLCQTCPVPEIRRANACKTLTLHAEIGRSRWRFWSHPHMVISATCSLSTGTVRDPRLGCGLCHAPLEFVVQDDSDPNAQGKASA
jgi:hypothetical protein